MNSTEEQIHSHPVDILSARRWQSALFTTYAFSISFFESVVFQALTHRSPCEEICVVVDTDGYRSSLMERGATRVGRDYTLIPVLAPGVFHPKCTYLSGPDGDLLLVGSGNLTFGGYGRNAEVLEVLQPQTHREAFLDFADFLGALASESRSQLAKPECIESFARRARTAAADAQGGDSGGRVRLLHSCKQTVVEQLSEYVAQYGTATRTTVLSPFFDPNGAAILKLTETLRCSNLRVGLPTGSEQTSTFPFGLMQGKGLKLGAVRARLQEDTDRPLHAKWIEVETEKGTVTLTGSVNATYAALCSTKNIEVGVVRFSDRPNDQWDDALLPESDHIGLEPEITSKNELLVYARLLADGRIIGSLLNRRESAGTWRLRLQRSTVTLMDTLVEIGPLGEFETLAEDTNKLLSLGTIRVRLTRDANEATGWLEMDELVRMSLEHRSVFSALSRFLSHNATDDDDVALLNYLAVSSSHHLEDLSPTQLLNAGVSESASQGDRASETIPLQLIAPSDEQGPPHSVLRFGASEKNSLSHWFRQFRDRILRPSVGRHEYSEAPRQREHPSEDDEELDALVTSEQTSNALRDFDTKMLETLSHSRDADSCRKLLCIWHEVTLYMFCQRLHRPEDVPEFLRRWTAHALLFSQGQEPPQALERIFVTSVAILAYFAMQAETERPLQLLHEALEQFYRKRTVLSVVEQALEKRWEHGVGRMVLGVEKPEFDAYLKKVFTTDTSLDQVLVLLAQIQNGAEIDFTRGPLAAESQYAKVLADDVLHLVAHGSPRRRIMERYDDRFDYSCCNYRFPSNARANYMSNRIAKCSQCGKLNMRLKP